MSDITQMPWDSAMLDSISKEYTVINKTLVSDGLGGTETAWIDGAVVRMATWVDNSTEMKIAQKQGVTAIYSFIAPKNVVLDYHTVFRSNEDGTTYRITTRPDDVVTPDTSSLGMRLYQAELFTIPKE